jgi:hypothetical protein
MSIKRVPGIFGFKQMKWFLEKARPLDEILRDVQVAT